MQSKVRRNNALSLLLLLLPYVTTGFLLSDAYINIIMEYHENARKSVEPRAADMQMLVYDAELERLAWKWAQRCVYEHPDDNWSDYKDYGQNLAYVTLRDPLEALYMTLVMWWQEKIGYNIEDDSCTLDYCTHYTQMIWGNTSKIGCAINRCDDLVGRWDRTQYWVCQYWPRGNWIGDDRYEAGPSCNKCRPGQKCKKRQCID